LENGTVRKRMKTITTLLVLAVGALVALSLTMLASATMLDSKPDESLFTQAGACLAGVVAMVVMSAVDYRRWMRGMWLVYGGAMALLILVLLIGHEAKGARRWLWGTQPAEIGKFALILALAWYGSRYASRMQEFGRGICGSVGLVAPLIGLVLLEPDRGTGALMVGLTLMLLLLAGARWLYIVAPAILGGAAIAAMVVVSPMARDRIDAWIHPEAHRDGASHQVLKGLYAFAQGGIEGRGLGRGTLKYNVPEVHTDFILPAVGEELGLTFTLAIVVAYLTILICGLMVAMRAPDQFGLLLAAGITLLIVAQAMINIGVVTAVFPNKGMPLPFVSRGGSNLAVLMTMVGVLVSVARADRSESNDSSPTPERKGVGGRRNPFSSDTDFVGAA
jgi:cell division protein FtsW